MTREEFELSRAICEVASKGPWTPANVLHLCLKGDVEFAAHARTALPKALDHIEELETAAISAVSARQCDASDLEGARAKFARMFRTRLPRSLFRVLLLTVTSVDLGQVNVAMPVCTREKLFVWVFGFRK